MYIYMGVRAWYDTPAIILTNVRMWHASVVCHLLCAAVGSARAHPYLGRVGHPPLIWQGSACKFVEGRPPPPYLARAGHPLVGEGRPPLTNYPLPRSPRARPPLLGKGRPSLVGKGRPPLGGMAGHPYVASIGVCRACSVLGARHGRRAACGASACAMHTPLSAFSYDPAF